MMTRLLATTTVLVLGMAMTGYAEDTKLSKSDGEYGQIKTAEDVANKLNMLNHAEIACGKLGQRKSENAEVKEFARALEADHTSANEQLQSFAKAKNIDLENADDTHGDHQGPGGKPGDPGSVGAPGTQGTPGHDTDIESGDVVSKDAADSTSSNGDRKDRKSAKRDQKEEMKRLEALSGEEFDREYTTMMAQSHVDVIRQLTAAQDGVEDAEAKALITSILPVLQKHNDQAAALSRKLGGNPDAEIQADAR